MPAGISIVELSDTWSLEDERDVTDFSMQHAAALYPDDEEPD